MTINLWIYHFRREVGRFVPTKARWSNRLCPPREFGHGRVLSAGSGPRDAKVARMWESGRPPRQREIAWNADP